MATATCFSGCFLKRDNQNRVGVVFGGLVGVAFCGLVGVAFIIGSSSAVRLSVSGCGLALESISSSMICVGWLTVADVRPGPLT